MAKISQLQPPELYGPRRCQPLMIRPALLTVWLPLLTWGQSPSAAFDVASIKPSASLSERALLQPVPGRLLMQNFAPRTLIAIAWGLESYEVSGGPPWMVDARYNIEAKAEGNPSVEQMEGPMLQALLLDRFQLKFHRETREMQGFELRRLDNVKLPPPVEGSCIPYSVNAPPPLAPRPGQTLQYCGFVRNGGTGPNRALSGGQISTSALAKALIRGELHRPVVDRTGLTETFDLHLTWTSESAAAPDASDAVSIFTAIREQLGLKLEPARVPMEVFVIDRLERPSAN